MERSADWIEQARGDLAHARNDLEDAFYDWACFSSQQAAEKAAKAVLQRYTRAEAERLVAHADQVIRFCEGLSPLKNAVPTPGLISGQPARVAMERLSD